MATDGEDSGPWVLRMAAAASARAVATPAGAPAGAPAAAARAATPARPAVVAGAALRQGPAQSNATLRAFVHRRGSLFTSLAGVAHTFVDHDVSVELDDEQVARGRLLSVTPAMDVALAGATLTRRDGSVAVMDRLRVPGRAVRYLLFPEDASVKAHVKEYVRNDTVWAAARGPQRQFHKKARGTAAVGPVVAGFGPT